MTGKLSQTRCRINTDKVSQLHYGYGRLSAALQQEAAANE